MMRKVAIIGNSTRPTDERWHRPLNARGIETAVIKPHEVFDPARDLAAFDGLLLPGGFAHIHPDFVRGKTAHRDDEYDILRDHTALKAARYALDHDMPALGICRGMQEMIVAQSGFLEKLDNPVHAQGYKYKGDLEKMDTRMHGVIFQKGGLLWDLFDGIYDDAGCRPVNSIHEEGITVAQWRQCDQIQSIFRIEAVCEDEQVIEGISALDHPFYLGVQAHFELPGRMHDRLFDHFVGVIKR